MKQKKDDAVLRTIVNLPNGNGKKIKVAVIWEENKIQQAIDSGADLSQWEVVLSDSTIKKASKPIEKMLSLSS